MPPGRGCQVCPSSEEYSKTTEEGAEDTVDRVKVTSSLVQPPVYPPADTETVGTVRSMAMTTGSGAGPASPLLDTARNA